MCCQLFEGLLPSDNTIVASLYATWSFLHLTGRMFTVTLLATRINCYAHEVGNLISLWCPMEFYSGEVEVISFIFYLYSLAHMLQQLFRNLIINFGKVKQAVLRTVVGNQAIGLTRLKCFTLYRPVMLSICFCVFTIEIVFLQTYKPNESS